MEREHGRDSVKLHVTLINSKYGTRNSGTNVEETGSTKNIRKQRVTFDGSKILEKFADFDFGVMELEDIHLSQRHSTGTDGYYQPTCVIASML